MGELINSTDCWGNIMLFSFFFLLSSSVFSCSIFPNWVLLSLSLFISVSHHILLLLQQKSGFHWAHGINLKSVENLLLVPEAALKRELEEQRFAHFLWLLNSSYFLVFFPPCLWEIFGWMPLIKSCWGKTWNIVSAGCNGNSCSEHTQLIIAIHF